MTQARGIVDPSLELEDPNPDIFELFRIFDTSFFWARLGSVVLSWSPRMTSTAGVCRYDKGLCTISLSRPLLSFRPRKDLVETLLHEMIHAYNILIERSHLRENNPHGDAFKAHMNRINKLTGTQITIYHSFHDEVRLYQTHVWRCEGPCRDRPPFFGYVKRAMNRAPGPNDTWHSEHQRSCGGAFIKIKEPEKKKPETEAQAKKRKAAEGTPKISKYFKNTPSTTLPSSSGISSTSKVPSAISSTSTNRIATISSVPTPQKPSTSNFVPFGGSGSSLGGGSDGPKRSKLLDLYDKSSIDHAKTNGIANQADKVDKNTEKLSNGEINGGPTVNCPYCRKEIADDDAILASHLTSCNEVDLTGFQDEDGDVYIADDSFSQ